MRCSAHTFKSFSHVMGEDFESEWANFRVSVAGMAFRSCDMKVIGT